jgi:RND family efflux transporter MFP subunit
VNSFAKCFILCCTVAAGSVACRPGEVIEPTDLKAPVSIGDVSEETIEDVVRTTGTLRAVEQAVLLTESEGRFTVSCNDNGEPLREGSRVAAKQRIALISNPELTASIALDARREESDQAEHELKRLHELKSDGLIADSEVEPAQTAATRARYAYEGALAQLDKMQVISPISGRIVRLAEIVNGDRVVPGTEVAVVMDYTTVIAEVDIANPDFPRVKEGQSVVVRNFALKDEQFEGTVAIIRPVADEMTRAFKAEIEIDNPDEELRPGMFVQCDITVARHENAIVVQPELVLTRNNKPVVFVVEEEKAVARDVRIGIETKEKVEIIEGLNSDDTIIVEGHETLRDGTPVRITK